MDKEFIPNNQPKKSENSEHHKNHHRKKHYYNNKKNHHNNADGSAANNSAAQQETKTVEAPKNENTNQEQSAQRSDGAHKQHSHNKHRNNYNRRHKNHRPARNDAEISNADTSSTENSATEDIISTESSETVSKESSFREDKHKHNNKSEKTFSHSDKNTFKPKPHYESTTITEEPSDKEAYKKEESVVPDTDEALAVNDISDPQSPDTVKEEDKQEELVDIIGVRFKVGGKTYYFAPNGIIGKKGKYAIVETTRGLEFGEIVIANSKVSESEFVPPLRPVIRLATEADIAHHDENVKKQDEAFKICNEKIIAHGLDMKLIDAQYTFDNSKLLFYFTSSGRVDFRELVKDLASVFKTRIELRQIGIRDEAKIIGGLGICGRSLCCAVFLSDFGQVSIKMAKDQNLSLNSSKISGVCGRLMCCLRYEYETYTQEIKNTPPIDSKVKTADGIGTVTEIIPLAGKIKVRLDEKPDQAPRTYHRDDVTVISASKSKQQ